MDVNSLIDDLGYAKSPNFLAPGGENSLDRAADFGHIFRRAQGPCNLRGVYTLRHPEETGTRHGRSACLCLRGSGRTGCRAYSQERVEPERRSLSDPDCPRHDSPLFGISVRLPASRCRRKRAASYGRPTT